MKTHPQRLRAPSGLWRISVLVSVTLTITGCQACATFNKQADQIRQGYEQIKAAAHSATTAEQTVKNTGQQAADVASQAAAAAADSVGKANSECGGYRPPPGETLAEFVNTFVEVAGKDAPDVQAVLYAVQGANAFAFIKHLQKLAHGSAATQAEASCMLDRFYALIPAYYYGQLAPLAGEVSYDRTTDWYELTPAEKITLSGRIEGGNPLWLLIERDIQASTPKGL